MNTVEYMYVLFLTPYGKNYGCLAFDKANISNGEVRIAGSFCNPNDKHLFSKNQSIKLANENLVKNSLDFTLEYDEYYGYDYLNEELATFYFNSADLPKWVEKCICRKAFQFTLKQDNLSLETLVQELDLSQVFFEELRNALIGIIL